MYVDDYDHMTGGYPNAIAVRLSPEEINLVKKGRVITGKNKSGNKTEVIVMVDKNPKETSAS